MTQLTNGSAPIAETPVQKALTAGMNALSTSELLQIVVGEEAVPYLLSYTNNNLLELGKATINQLAALPKMTQRKAVQLVAVLEIGSRKAASAALDRKVVSSSIDVAEYFRASLQDYGHEVFAVMYLNRSNKVIKIEQISSGGITGTVADPRMILKNALEINAVSMILCHNHPSGSLRPSKADEELTYKIKEAAKYFDMKVLDHLIVSSDGYFSFADEGLLY